MAPSTAMTGQVKTFETQGYGTATANLIREVGRKLFYVDPSAAPFTLLTERSGSQVTNNPKFEWFEKDRAAKNAQVDGAHTSAVTAITVDAGYGLYFQKNDLVYVPSTGEIFRVAADPTDTSLGTVVRGVAGTTAAAIGDNADLFIIGSSWQEGADVGTPQTWQEVHKFNYTQIHRRPFGATRTLEGTDSYLGANRARVRAEKAIEHAIDIERAFLWGGRQEDTTNKLRYSGGFTFFATANVKDVGGTLTEAELEDWLADVFHKTSGSDSRVFFCAPKVISVIDQLAAARLQMVPSDRTYGIAVRQLLTSHGTLNIVKHRLLEMGLGSTGFGERGYAVDVKSLKYRPFSNGSTKLLMDRQGNGVDAWTDEYLTEAGFQLTLPDLHGTLKNVTG